MKSLKVSKAVYFFSNFTYLQGYLQGFACFIFVELFILWLGRHAYSKRLHSKNNLPPTGLPDSCPSFLALHVLSCPVMSISFATHQAPLVREIFQAKILEWIAISFSRGSSQPRDSTLISSFVEEMPPVLQADSLPLSHQGSPVPLYILPEIFPSVIGCMCVHSLFIWNSNLTEHLVFYLAISHWASLLLDLLWNRIRIYIILKL